jgi:hypothetical protein
MKRNSAIPSLIIVESGLAPPFLRCGWLGEVRLDVLGPTDDLFDAYRLARDRQRILAIVDKRRGVDCRQRLYTTLVSAELYGRARRKGIVSEPHSELPFTPRCANKGGFIVTSGAIQTP